MKNYFLNFCLTVFVVIIFTAQSHAGKDFEKTKLPESLLPGIAHLLALVDPAGQEDFDVVQIAPVLEFLKQSKNQEAIYYADKKSGLTSAYYDFDVQRSLTDIIKYNFNPDIPAFATAPASSRLSHWVEIEGNGSIVSELWQELANLDRPIVIKGSEIFENTPDTFSGAYYKYDLHRTIVLFTYEKRKVLISVSKQKDVSRVGKKGYILGPDDNWDYYYTGEPGLTVSGLGWVRSYMYDSQGINIYYQFDENKPAVRCAAFKWLRAGWAKINVVKSHHIHAGLQRFARSFKEIMESPLLPSVEVLAAGFSEIKNLSLDSLQNKIKIYARILQKRYANSHSSSAKWKPKLLQDKGHWARMSKQEMQAVLAVEYMKSILGKTQKEEVAALLRLPK
jgi:hypothetical protein